MAGHISRHVILAVVLVNKTIKDVDQILWVLEIVLDSDVMGNSSSSILKDTVKMSKAVLDNLSLGHIFDDIEETSNDILSLLLLVWIIHDESLLRVLGVQKLLDSGSGAWLEQV